MVEKAIKLTDLRGSQVLAELMRDMPNVTEDDIKERITPTTYTLIWPDDSVPKLSASQREELARASATAAQASHEEIFGPILDIGGGTTVDVYATRNAITECRRLGMGDSEVATIVGDDVFAWLVESKLVAKSEK